MSCYFVWPMFNICGMLWLASQKDRMVKPFLMKAPASGKKNSPCKISVSRIREGFPYSLKLLGELWIHITYQVISSHNICKRNKYNWDPSSEKTLHIITSHTYHYIPRWGPSSGKTLPQEIIPSTLFTPGFFLENWVLWLLFILVSDTQSASIRVFQIAERGGGEISPTGELESLLGGDFFIGRREPDEEWFWPFEPFSKLKAGFC